MEIVYQQNSSTINLTPRAHNKKSASHLSKKCIMLNKKTLSNKKKEIIVFPEPNYIFN